MNLEEYLSFVSLSLAQTGQKRQNGTNTSFQDYLDMSEREKFYHYITLKRWMADYQKNMLASKGKECHCSAPQAKNNIFQYQSSLLCSVIEEGPTMQIQQNNAKQGSSRNQGLNILFMFFQQLQHRFRHDRKYLHRISRKLKLNTSLEEFEIWVRANLPTSQSKYSAQSTKSLMNSTRNKQESLLLRVLLKKYLKNEAYVQMLTSKDNKQMSLKDSLLDLRSIEEQLFKHRK